MSEPTPEQIKAGVLAAYEFDLETQPYADMVRAIYTAMRALERPSDEAGERVKLADRIKQIRAERKRYFDVEGDGVDLLLCDIQSFLDRPAIAAMPEDRWQPIETAPKDGTHFLACQAGTSFGWLNGGPLAAVQTVVHWFDDGFYTSVNELAPERPFAATHWKPLDESPECSACDDTGWTENTGSVMPGIGVPCDCQEPPICATCNERDCGGHPEPPQEDASK